jgi:NAD(P)-dependent dehydrogenase (short-subunit alcohol dehydrogenase family)
VRLFDLTGRTALVTGSTGILGSAIARALRDAGAQVAITGRDAGRLERVGAAIGPGTAAIAADLLSDDGIEVLFRGVEEHFGALDILVNNAGVATDAILGSVREPDFADVLRLNVTAAYLCIQQALPLFRNGGKVVNIGSIYGTLAADDRVYAGSDDMVRASAPYLASKGALVQLTRDLATRLAARGIQVNCVSPGGVEGDQPAEFKRRYSDRVPAGRMARTDDIVGAVVYFSSSASDYTTGQNLVIDGGLSAW